MTIDFWLGLAIIPALIAVALIFWMLYSLGTRAWSKLHVSMLYRVELESDPISFEEMMSDDRSDNHSKAIQRIVKGLQGSPRLVSFRGLGYAVVFVRDYKRKGKDE